MAQKFFLFKRKDPAVSGGALFSDNGKGISVISFPASNLAYMAANKGAVTMYFNDSAPFEENSLSVAGESFEKTSVTVSCDSGAEADLMEDIINFINRDTAKNVMKFDATGAENTFGAKTAKPVIDARVRARPVERGLVGTDAVVTGLDSNAVIRGVDFLKVADKPIFDYEPDQISAASLPDGRLLTSSLVNGGTAGNTADASISSSGFVPVIRDGDQICSKRTIAFNISGALVPDVNITGITDNMTGASLANQPGLITSVIRDSANITSEIPGDDRPTFKVSTDGSANVTDFRVVLAGSKIESGDELTVTFADGNVVFTVSDSDIAKTANQCLLEIAASISLRTTITPIQPYFDHVVYMTFVRPNGSLLRPLTREASPNTGGDSSTNQSSTIPFPNESLGDQFQFAFSESLTSNDATYGVPKRSRVFESDSSFSVFHPEGSKEETSNENLITIVFRRTASNRIFVYDKFGELIFEKEPDETTNGGDFYGEIGIPYEYKLDEPSIRLARIGFIPKDIGDLSCRNIAVQLNDRYTTPKE
jgi:hypothetical protein